MTAIYRDPTTYELLFMERRDDDGRWIPCLGAMEAWRTAAWRLYQIGPDEYVTTPGFRQWSLLPPAEEANIDHLLAHPWIPDGAALDVSEGDVPMTDLLLQLSVSGDDHDGPPGGGGGAVTAESAWSRAHQPHEDAPSLLAAALLAPEPTTIHVHHTHHHVWDLLDAVARPALVWDDPFLLRAHAPAPPLSAAALALRLLAAAATERAETEEPKVHITPMPKHVADLVLRDAEARGATCPISMEPIKATDASVTSCGHVFQTQAIRHWLTGHDTCPQCRQPCSATDIRSTA